MSICIRIQLHSSVVFRTSQQANTLLDFDQVAAESTLQDILYQNVGIHIAVGLSSQLWMLCVIPLTQSHTDILIIGLMACPCHPASYEFAQGSW